MVGLLTGLIIGVSIGYIAYDVEIDKERMKNRKHVEE